MSQLIEQEINQIKEEAERLYPNYFPKNFPPEGRANIMGYNEGRKQGYIAAATLYQERANRLLEALESIIIYVDPIKFADPILNAKAAITNYNESLKG